MKLLNNLAHKLKKPLFAVALAGTCSYLVLQAPQMQRNWLRSNVGSQVFIISNEDGSRGGTGFAVQAPSGKVYTITNAHVCAIAENGKMWASSATMRKIPLQVIESSKVTDLCILSPVAGKKGLKVADGLELGEEINLVGHPMLMPITLTRGEMIGYSFIVVGIDLGYCDKEEGMYKTVETMFGPFCTEQLTAGLTTVPSLGGNSGSPVTNYKGEVVAVLFAGNPSVNWGITVQLSDIKTLLKAY